MDFIPAAIVVSLREASHAPELLLVHRNPELPVQGGAWAFPGGRVSPRDGALEEGQRLTTARVCAAREMREETGLVLDPSDLALLTCWVTPPELTTRFFTWMFISPHGNGEVTVDGKEIIGYRWCSARQALDLHHAGRIRLAPPVYVILSNLIQLATVEAVVDNAGQLIPERFEPRLVNLPDGGCAIYREDAAYADKNIARAGPRHRLWMRESGWRYERRFDP